MKIIVTSMPDTPKQCLFSEENLMMGLETYICTLKQDIPGKHKNSPCICKDTKRCECLITLLEANYQR